MPMPVIPMNRTKSAKEKISHAFDLHDRKPLVVDELFLSLSLNLVCFPRKIMCYRNILFPEDNACLAYRNGSLERPSTCAGSFECFDLFYCEDHRIILRGHYRYRNCNAVFKSRNMQSIPSVFMGRIRATYRVFVISSVSARRVSCAWANETEPWVET